MSDNFLKSNVILGSSTKRVRIEPAVYTPSFAYRVKEDRMGNIPFALVLSAVPKLNNILLM